MLSIRKLRVVVPAMCAVFAGALLCASAPALAAAPEAPALTVESHYPSPAHPSTEAVLHGVLNPGGSGPQLTFELGTYEFLYNEGPGCEGGAATARGISLGEGAEVLPTETIGGLNQGKEYTVCLRFVTAGGEAVKPEVHFTTSVTPEAPLTREAESITGTTAVLNGELNPLNESKVGYEFVYNQGSGCEGGSTTTLGSEQMGKAIPVSTSVTGLAPSTVYAFCAVAVNASGEPVLGAPSTFKTLPVAPEVVALGEKASSVTPFEAHLEAAVNAENQATSCVFEYGTSTAYSSKVPCEQTTIEGFYEQGVGLTVAHLAPATLYHFRVVLENKGHEKTEGPDQQFTTPALLPPVVDSEAASAATSTSARLEAQINPEYQATSYTFEYSTAESGGKLQPPITKLAGTKPLPAGFGDQTASVSTGPVLTAGTTYYYRVVAENGQSGTEGKPVPGAMQSFATVPAPSTDAATAITTTTAMLHGTLTALNATFATETYFDYNLGSTCTGAGNTAPEPASATAISTEATGLEPNARYTVCLVSTNVFGSVVDTKVPAISLTTLAAAPSIENPSASVQSPFTATLEATVNPNNEKTTCAFEYGTDPSLATGTTTVPCLPLGEGGTPVNTSVALTGLQKHTKYYYRLTATNTAGTTVYPTIGEFETQVAIAPSVESESVAFVTSTGATLQAQVNPNYQETTATFEYSTKESILLAGTGTQVPGGTLPAGNNSGQAVHADLRGVLQPDEKYYYRVVATNTAGTTKNTSTIQSFTTPTPPTANTGAAENIGSGTATVTGIVNPEGLETHYTIEYGPTTSYGQNTTSTNAGSETTPIPTGPIHLNTLLASTTYHYRLIAINTIGETTYGADMQFTTTAAPPVPTAPSNGSGEAPPQSTSSTSTAGIFPNLTAIAPVPATKEPGEATTPSEVKSLTRAQKLTKALKQCKRGKKKGARASCEKAARGKYGPKTSKGKRGKS